MIEYQGETFRDDRMFVINLSRGTVTRDSKKITRWLLFTYRNTIQLPIFRSDDFETREDATEYLKKEEPNVPVISNGGQPIEIPKNVDRWEFWTDWLAKNGLQSAISGQQHVPDWVGDQGHDPRDNYQHVIELTEDDLN